MMQMLALVTETVLIGSVVLHLVLAEFVVSLDENLQNSL